MEITIDHLLNQIKIAEAKREQHVGAVNAINGEIKGYENVIAHLRAAMSDDDAAKAAADEGINAPQIE